MTSPFIPISAKDISERGWQEIDVLFITGDAYVDHPSFGVPLLARLLEAQGLRIAIMSQPLFPGRELRDLKSGNKSIVSEKEALNDFRRLGTPRLFVAIGSGAVDSMINNYTANKKQRSDDPYSPGDRSGARPDRATTVYSQLAKKAFPETPIIIGGIEASLRRLAHYDFWSNSVHPSILLEAQADFLIYGMGEKALSKISSIFNNNSKSKEEQYREIKKIRGICYQTSREESHNIEPRLVLPSYEEIKRDKKKFLKTTLLFERELNPFLARTVVQPHGKNVVIINPPAEPLSQAELDKIFSLPFRKEPHPIYYKTALKQLNNPKLAKEHSVIKAYETIKHSITSHRGCFGGCSFCGLGLHQGKFIQSRSEDSILKEISGLERLENFAGTVSDIGGPSANMYEMGCTEKTKRLCQRPSCLYPSICKNLKHDSKKLIELLRKAKKLAPIKRVLIASGVRFDLAIEDQNYLQELVAHHVGGHLKVAPEHASNKVLRLMRKPNFEKFLKFRELFTKHSKAANKEQYLVPYFISNFPGCTDKDMSEVTTWARKVGIKLQQVQSFIPLPMTLAGAIYYTGLDPETMEPLYVAKGIKQKTSQQKLLQPHLRKYRQQKGYRK